MRTDIQTTIVSSLLLLLLPPADAFYSPEPFANSADTGLSFPIKKAVHPHSRRDKSVYTILEASGTDSKTSTGVHQDGSDFSYFISAHIGGSDKEYHLLIDTGSSDTWVMSSACKSKACDLHNLFDSSQSKSTKALDKKFSLAYGTGNVSGDLYKTSLKIADFEVDDYVVGLSDEVSEHFVSYPMDGILGLSRGTKSSLAVANGGQLILDALKKQGVIKNRVFGIRLWRASDGNPNSGVINFGFADKAQYTGDMVYAPLVDETKYGFWQIQVDDFSMNGASIGFSPHKAIMDTGTSFMILPLVDAETLHSAISGAKRDPKSSGNGQDRWLVPCDTSASFGLIIKGKNFDIRPDDYIGSETSDDKSLCYSNIIGRTIYGNNVWVVGDVFFKNVYTVFDLEKGRVGVAKVATGTAPSKSGDGDSDDPSATATSGSSPTSTGDSDKKPKNKTLGDVPNGDDNGGDGHDGHDGDSSKDGKSGAAAGLTTSVWMGTTTLAACLYLVLVL